MKIKERLFNQLPENSVILVKLMYYIGGGMPPKFREKIRGMYPGKEGERRQKMRQKSKEYFMFIVFVISTFVIIFCPVVIKIFYYSVCFLVEEGGCKVG